MFLLGVALMTPLGLTGTALYVLGHGLVKGALFLGTGILLNRFGSVDTNELRGAGRRFPGLGLLFLGGGLALSGLPPFGTWLGKSIIEESSGQLGYAWLSPILLAASALTGGAVLRSAAEVFLGLGPAQSESAETPRREHKETKKKYDRAPSVMFVPAAASLCLALTAGLWPGLGQNTEIAARAFQDQQGYAATVLGHSNSGGNRSAGAAGLRASASPAGMYRRRCSVFFGGRRPVSAKDTTSSKGRRPRRRRAPYHRSARPA